VTVVINEAGMRQFFNSTTGPVGRILARKADQVMELAVQNASVSGPTTLGRDTGDLLNGLRIQLSSDGTTVRAEIGTTAEHRGFDYPAYWDRNGRPWLTKALRDVIPG